MPLRRIEMPGEELHIELMLPRPKSFGLRARPSAVQPQPSRTMKHHGRPTQLAGLILWVLAAPRPTAIFAQQAPPSAPPSPQLAQSATGLPVPRFASLRVDRVNLRQGPGTDYPIAWVFQRAGLPVEVLREFEGWRQVRDSDGSTGWMQASTISGRRTAIVAPWDAKLSPPPTVPMTDGPSPSDKTVAIFEPGVIVNLLTCDGKVCRVSIAHHRGYLPQSKLWGIYPDEMIK